MDQWRFRDGMLMFLKFGNKSKILDWSGIFREKKYTGSFVYYLSGDIFQPPRPCRIFTIVGLHTCKCSCRRSRRGTPARASGRPCSSLETASASPSPGTGTRCPSNPPAPRDPGSRRPQDPDADRGVGDDLLGVVERVVAELAGRLAAVHLEPVGLEPLQGHHGGRVLLDGDHLVAAGKLAGVGLDITDNNIMTK